MEFDSFLDKYIGQFGKYQVWMMLFISIENIFMVFHILSPVFLVGEPKHLCELPPVNFTNCTLDEFLHFAIPLDKDGKFSSCHMYKRNYSQITDYDVCLKDSRQSTVNNVTSLPDEAVPIVQCDSWEYDKALYTSTMVTEWDLVCEDQYKASSVSAVYMAGWIVGLFLFGFISDWMGRKPVVLIAGFTYVAAGIALALVPNLAAALAMRFIQAGCGSAKSITTFVIVTEMVGPDWRIFVMVLYHLYWVAGYILLAGLAYIIRDWRTLELAISSPEIIYLIIFIFIVPESPRWLLTKNKPIQAHAILRQMAKQNSKECPKEINITQSKVRIGTGFDLVRTAGMRKSTLILTVAWSACGFVYYGLSLNTSNLGGSPYLNFLIAGAIEIPAYLLLIPLLRRFGRVCSFIAFMVTAGVFLLGAAAVPRDLVWLLVSVSMVGKFCISSAFLIIWFYTVELYPTEIRSIGLNYISTASRVSALMATYVALLGDVFIALPAVVFGVIALISGLSSCGLIETKGAPLSQTVREAEEFIQNSSRLCCCRSIQHNVEIKDEEEMDSLKDNQSDEAAGQGLFS